MPIPIKYWLIDRYLKEKKSELEYMKQNAPRVK